MIKRLLVVLCSALIAGSIHAEFDPGECSIDGNVVALWHCNAGIGTTLDDASGNGKSANLIGTTKPQWSGPGLFGGNGLHLTCGYNNTANKFGAIQLPSGLLNLQNMTIEMYLNWDYQTTGPKSTDQNFFGYLIYDTPNIYVRGDRDYDASVSPLIRCKLTYGVGTSTGNLIISTPTTYSLPREQWKKVAFTRQYSSGNTTISIYINDQLAATGSRAGSPSLSGGLAQIGSSVQTTVSWGGAIDEIRVSNIARSSFCNGSTPNCGDWGFLRGDISSPSPDCCVNFEDLLVLASQWLQTGDSLTADFAPKDSNVNGKDLAVLALDWMACTDPDSEAICNHTNDELVVVENSGYQCQLSIGTGNGDRLGLVWNRIYNKSKAAEYIYSNGRMPIFMVAGDGFLVSSNEFSVGTVVATTAGSEQHWQIPLTCSAKQLQAQLTIDSNDSAKMNWSLSITNTAGSARKLQPIFPVMGRIDIGNSLLDNYYFYPWRSGVVGKIDCDFRNEYGNLAWMQVVSVFNPSIGAGLYTYPKDSSGGFKGIPFKKSYAFGDATVMQSEIVATRERPNIGDPLSPTDVLAGVTKGIAYTYYYPKIEIGANANYTLPTTVIGVNSGGWKEALSDYSTWAHTWYQHVNTPQWFKNVFNSVGAWPSYYSNGSSYTRSSSMNNPDTMHMEQWAYWWDGADPSGPVGYAGDYYYNQALGGITAFRNEIQAIQAKGTHETLYINNRMCWSGTNIGQTHGQAWQVMDPPGVYATYAGPTELLECAFEPNAWANYIEQTCQRLVREVGVHGIYLDELPIMQPCYNPNHTHYQQDKYPLSVSRMVQYLTGSRTAMTQEYSDAILMTEHAGSDYFSQFMDGSWSQTFYKAAFPFAEQYYDENSLNYFRFCFPEFKLLEWGPSDDMERRCFFNGIGICSYPLSGFVEMTGQVLKENGDAFASLSPEPLIDSNVANVLVNKFPIAAKVLYTVYNKNINDVNGVPIIEVDSRQATHYVELTDDNIITATPGENSKDQLAFRIKAGQVLCVAQLPQVIQATRNSNVVSISLSSFTGSETLVAFFNYDSSAYGFGDGMLVSLTNGQGQFTVPAQFVNAKIILKLYSGDLLLDELVMGATPAAPTGVLVRWHLDENTGTVSYDSTSGNHNLKIGSTFFWQTGNASPISPYTGLFSNTSCQTYCSSWLHPNDINDQLTATAYVRLAGVDTTCSIVLALDKKFMIRIDGGQTAVQFLVMTPDGVWHQASAEPKGAGVSLIDSQWHRISGVYDGRRDTNGNANVYLYWDGNKKATASFAISGTTQPLMSGGSSKVCIGALPWNITGTTYNFMGRIDEITISNIIQSQP